MKAAHATCLAAAALLPCCVAGLAHAQRMPLGPMGDAQVSELLEGDATLEARLDVDLNGDGDIDTVFVAQGSDSRHAVAMLAWRRGEQSGHRRIGRLELDRPPLVRAGLRVREGVLEIEDVTGSGDTTTQAAYRFRFDRKRGGLLLVGLDAARYSRKRRHDAVRLNWDPVSGHHALAYGVPGQGPDSEAGYRYGPARRSTRRSPALAMEQTPSADQLLWQAGVRLGEGPRAE